jgi:hypothetical protein
MKLKHGKGSSSKNASSLSQVQSRRSAVSQNGPRYLFQGTTTTVFFSPFPLLSSLFSTTTLLDRYPRLAVRPHSSYIITKSRQKNHSHVRRNLCSCWNPHSHLLCWHTCLRGQPVSPTRQGRRIPRLAPRLHQGMFYTPLGHSLQYDQLVSHAHDSKLIPQNLLMQRTRVDQRVQWSE